MISEIVITPNVPYQKLFIQIGNETITFYIKWNSRFGFWSADIARSEDEYLITGLALMSGNDLFSPFNFELGELYVIDLTGSGGEMTLDNVGIDFKLISIYENE